MQARVVQLDPQLEKSINEVLKARHHFELFSASDTNCKKIAASVKQLSDFYIQNPGAPTPWQQSWCQLAYLAYYLPLNSLRCRAVFQEAQRFNFFDHIRSVIDFGSGLGSASLELKILAPLISNFTYIEKSEAAIQLHQALELALSEPNRKKTEDWLSSVNKISERKNFDLGLFSYSLNELEQAPEWLFQMEKLVLIEPASSVAGRKLLELRQQLIERGFFIWAPCTHQELCPLLTKSKSDWCHDRIHFAQSSWLQKIEAYLPMKNPTLTFSYLIASRQSPPSPNSVDQKLARITGDLLREKGKARQLICRGPEREFLAWMSRDGEAQEIPRGALVHWPENAEQKSNEIRLREAVHEA